MSRAATRPLDLARRFTAREAKELPAPGTDHSAVFSACERLRPSLTALVGSAGFGALLSRARALAVPEVPWLRALRVNADGSLEAPAEFDSPLDPDQVAQGRVALLAQLIGLLKAFIGDTLTMQVLREAWPERDPGDPRPRYGDEHAPTR